MIIDQIGYDPESDLANPASSVFCSHGSGVNIPWDEAEEMMHIPIEQNVISGSWSMNSGKVSDQEMKSAFEKAGGSNRNLKKQPQKNFHQKTETEKKN